MQPRKALDPFAVVVDAGDESSLATIAVHATVSVGDLRRLNPNLSSHAHTQPLPAGTVVRLPPRLDQQGSPCGSYFGIGPMEEVLRGVEARLDALVAKETSPLPELRPRRVLSKTECIVSRVREESERQLARIKEEYAECGRRTNLLQFLVDIEPVKQLKSELEKEFDGGRLQLKTLESANSGIFSKNKSHLKNAITASSRWNVRDTSEDYCLEEHSHRWEFTFFAPDSTKEVQDSWAVLSCQNIGALIDTFECRNSLPVSMSKNAFVFLGGTFYVDNRHAGVEGENYDDLTLPIREFQPFKQGESPDVKNIAFGRCPVKYISETTFADCFVRLGEFGLLRHNGWCSHYFYLSSVEILRGLERSQREKGAYPQRLMKAPTRVVRCRMCRQFPASVACYDDELSPNSPCPYCVPCFELLHATDQGVVEEGKFVTIKLPDGKYFTF